MRVAAADSTRLDTHHRATTRSTRAWGPIRGDERKLKQILLNLASNAVTLTPEAGRIDVRAGLVDGIPKVSVADTGVGFAPADQGVRSTFPFTIPIGPSIPSQT